MTGWYKAMWERSNAVWDRFMREYVFSEEPPFETKPFVRNVDIRLDWNPDGVIHRQYVSWEELKEMYPDRDFSELKRELDLDNPDNQ